MGLPERIRDARRTRGWTRERLAVEAQLSATTIGRVERGQLRPQANTLIALAKALDLPVDELAHEVGLTIRPYDPENRWAP